MIFGMVFVCHLASVLYMGNCVVQAMGPDQMNDGNQPKGAMVLKCVD
jgi:hypothetical protein